MVILTAKRSRQPSGGPSLDGKSIHIVGPRRLQNLLLAKYLGTHAAASCHLHVSQQELPAAISRNTQDRLVLLDCLEVSGLNLEALVFRVTAERRLPAALFNLPPGRGADTPALQRGIRGFFYESDSPETLLQGITRIFAGELWVSRSLLVAALEKAALSSVGREQPADLTQREVEILGALAGGATNGQIAAEMSISTHTVRTHIYNAYRKIGAENRVQAAQWTTMNIVGLRQKEL